MAVQQGGIHTIADKRKVNPVLQISIFLSINVYNTARLRKIN